MIIGNQAVVPPYAYDLEVSEDYAGFQCKFDSLGDPVFKKKD